MAREWTEAELRDLIAIEVSTGNTMQVLNNAIASGSLTTAVQAIATAANAHVAQWATQVTDNANEINRVLADCRTFIEQTCVESEAAKQTLTQEVDTLQIQFRDVAQFVEGVPDKVGNLNAKLESITSWLAQNQLVDVATNLSTLQTRHDSLQENVHRRPAGNSREAEISTNLSQILPTAETELCRCSKTTEAELCRFSRLKFGDRCCDSRDCHSAKPTADSNGSSVATAANSGADGSASGGTMQLSDILPSPEWSRKSRRHRRVHADID